MTISAEMRRKLRLGLFISLLAVSLLAAVAVNGDQSGLGQLLLGVLVALMLATAYVG